MGLFSSKKKIFVGVSNSKLIEDGTAPQAIKDSVTAYVNDSGKTNGQMSMSLVDYTNTAMDQSIVQGVKRLKRWIRKPNMYSTVGSTVAAVSAVSDNDIQNLVADAIQSKHTTLVTFYYLNNMVYDYGHLTKQALIDTKDFNPTTNKLMHNEIELYLHDAVIHTQVAIPPAELFPLSFNTMATPFRDGDIEREYTPENFVVDPLLQFDFYEAIGTNLFIISNKELITTTTVTTPALILEESEPPIESVEGEPVPEPVEPEPPTVVITEERGPVEVIGSIPELDKVYQVFIETIPEEELVSDETTTDEDGVITQVVVTAYYLHDHYECRYKMIGTYSDYIYSGDNDFDNLPIEDAIDIINGINEVRLSIQIAYSYEKLDGTVILAYDTLTEDEVSQLYTVGGKIPFGDFIPNLYFKANSSFVDSNKNSLMYKQSKKYAKKLNLNFPDLCEEIRKSVKEQHAIVHTYLKFAVNFASTNKADMEYLFNFSKKYFNFCDTENDYPIGFVFEEGNNYGIAGRTLSFADKVLRYEVFASSLAYYRGTTTEAGVAGTYTRGTGRLEVPPKGSSIGDFVNHFKAQLNASYTYFRYYITDTKFEEYRIFNIRASNLVKDGKWADSGGENSHLLIPVDFAVVNSIKGFRGKERFIYNCMYVEFLTYVVQKIRWYQRGIFKLLVFAISVAITVATGGAGVTVASVLMAAVTNLAIGMAINFAIKQLTKMLSPGLLKVVAGLIAIAGLAYGRFAAAGAGSFSKAFTIMFMKANQFLAVSNQLIKATIVKQGEEFQKKAKEHQQKMKTLEDYRKANYKYITDTNLSYLNEQEHRYEPLVIGETLDSMIARTLNTNPGLVTIDYIHGYVDYITTLPTVDETKYISLDEKEKDNAE